MESDDALDKAIEANDREAVRRLVEAKADLRRTGWYDATPLANAAALGRKEIVEYLLDAGADPNFGGCRSTLAIACGRDHRDVCKILLDAGADPNDQGIEGDTCLSVAVFKGHFEIVKLLVNYGAELEPLDEYIHLATRVNANGSHDKLIAYLESTRVSPDGLP